MHFRDYDPALGRWTAMDPVVHFDMSPYNAFDNNPVYWADPRGLASVSTGVAWLDGLFNNSGSGVTTWTNEGNGIWTTNGNENGGAGFFNTNIGVFTAFEPLAAVVIPKGVSFSSNRFWNIANGHTYWNSTFYANWRSKEFSCQLDQLQSGLDWLRAVPILGEPVDLINAGISAIRGDYAAAGYETFKEILRSPGSIEKVGGFLEKRLPDGRGIRFQENFQFKGFLD